MTVLLSSVTPLLYRAGERICLVCLPWQTVLRVIDDDVIMVCNSTYRFFRKNPFFVEITVANQNRFRFLTDRAQSAACAKKSAVHARHTL